MRNSWRELVSGRTWREAGYALAGLPMGIVGFVVTVVTLALGIGLAITVLGLGVLALSTIVVRFLGDLARRFINAALGTNVAPAGPIRPATGPFGRVGAAVTDAVAWRARAYLLLKLPVGIVSFTVAIVFWVYGFAAVSYAIWRPFLPCTDRSGGGPCHRDVAIVNHIYIDTAPKIGLLFLVGVLLLLAAPRVVRAIVSLDRALVRRLLGPVAPSGIETVRADQPEPQLLTTQRE